MNCSGSDRERQRPPYIAGVGGPAQGRQERGACNRVVCMFRTRREPLSPIFNERSRCLLSLIVSGTLPESCVNQKHKIQGVTLNAKEPARNAHNEVRKGIQTVLRVAAFLDKFINHAKTKHKRNVTLRRVFIKTRITIAEQRIYQGCKYDKASHNSYTFENTHSYTHTHTLDNAKNGKRENSGAKTENLNDSHQTTSQTQSKRGKQLKFSSKLFLKTQTNWNIHTANILKHKHTWERTARTWNEHNNTSQNSHSLKTKQHTLNANYNQLIKLIYNMQSFLLGWYKHRSTATSAYFAYTPKFVIEYFMGAKRRNLTA